MSSGCRANAVRVALVVVVAATTVATSTTASRTATPSGQWTGALPEGVRARFDQPDWGYTSSSASARIASANPRNSGSTGRLASRSAGGDPGVFDVRAFGAVGDGQTDDTPAFLAALAAAATAGGEQEGDVD
jgi:polygalacturonase